METWSITLKVRLPEPLTEEQIEDLIEKVEGGPSLRYRAGELEMSITVELEASTAVQAGVSAFVALNRSRVLEPLLPDDIRGLEVGVPEFAKVDY